MAARKRRPSQSGKNGNLRAKADKLGAKNPDSTKAIAAPDIQKLVLELQVHQVELEMQNDELRQAQVEIEESRARYVDLYDFSPVGYLTLSKASRIIEANLAAAGLLGVARRDLIGLIFTQFITPEDRDAFIRFKADVLASDSKLSCELKLGNNHTAPFWVSLDAVSIKDPEGGPPRVQCAISDIMKRKVAEADILGLNEELENRVRLRTAQLQEANRFLRDEGRRLRKAQEELRRKTADLERLAGSLEERVEDGSTKLAEASASLEVEVVQRQGTELERLRLAAAADQAGEGMIITDPGGIIHYANPAFERAAGLSKQELIGRSYFDFLNEKEGDKGLKEVLLDIVRLGMSGSSHIVRRGRSGQTRELDITFTPIKDRAGAVINYLSVEHDVTEQYRLDQYARRLQKMEALGTLAGGIAHDFNNILTPIIINMELGLMDLPEDSPFRPYLETPLAAAMRGKGLVSQIITFSRQKERAKQRLRLSPLVTETLDLLAASLPKNVEVRRTIEAAGDIVLADPAQIQQVVMNLCNNAGYAMRERGGVLEVGLAPVELDRNQSLAMPDLKPGAYIKLTVQDTGTGMTAEVMSKAFDPFFTTKETGEGSGLGLAVVLSIVKDLGGAISVESEAGKGASFSVFLPRIKGNPVRRERTDKALATGHERVLVVEDEKVQAETLELALKKLGYRVTAMDTSTGALACFRENPSAFDLIITDQTMPEMNGLTLAQEILKTRPDIPIILCTGFSEVVDLEIARAAGIAEFMMKPFTVREIASAIRQACDFVPGAPRLTRSD